MRMIPVMIQQLKINLQVKSDPLIYRKLTKSAKISKYPISILEYPLALCPLAINDLKWKDLVDRRHTCLSLFYKIVEYEVNAPSESIIISVKGRTKKQTITNIVSSHEPSQNGTIFQVLLPTLLVLRPSRIG